MSAQILSFPKSEGRHDPEKLLWTQLSEVREMQESLKLAEMKLIVELAKLRDTRRLAGARQIISR